MNKLFLEMLQNAIEECYKKILEYDEIGYENLEESDILDLTDYEGRYRSLKWTRDLYLNCCEEENEETTNN